MQLNQSKFRLNGNCGYVLRPDFLLRPDYEPSDPSSLAGVSISIQVIAARHLIRSGRSTTSPFVDVEILGSDYDTGIKLTTKTIRKFFYYSDRIITRMFIVRHKFVINHLILWGIKLVFLVS